MLKILLHLPKIPHTGAKHLSSDADSSTAAKKLFSIFFFKSFPAAIAVVSPRGGDVVGRGGGGGRVLSLVVKEG